MRHMSKYYRQETYVVINGQLYPNLVSPSFSLPFFFLTKQNCSNKKYIGVRMQILRFLDVHAFTTLVLLLFLTQFVCMCFLRWVLMPKLEWLYINFEWLYSFSVNLNVLGPMKVTLWLFFNLNAIVKAIGQLEKNPIGVKTLIFFWCMLMP